MLFAYKIVLVLVIGFAGWVLNAFAGDFDGSRPLSGTTTKVIEIRPHQIVDDVDPDTVGLPHKFQVDFEARVLQSSKESLVRKSIAFKRVAHLENKIVMQGADPGVEGVEDGLAWSLAISKKDGKSVLSASGDGVAYVVFGVCTPMPDGH